MTFRAKPCRDETVNDAMSLEVPRFVCAGVLSLFLLKQTVNEYRQGGLYDFWTIVSGVGLIIVIGYLIQALSARRQETN